MKIIGKTTGGYLVDMTEKEIAKSAGYNSDWDGEWKKARPTSRAYGSSDGLSIGAEIKVEAAYDFHSRITRAQTEARQAAGVLTGLAALLSGAMPDVIIPPAPPAEIVPAPETEGA